jgi:hypothetical protein
MNNLQKYNQKLILMKVIKSLFIFLTCIFVLGWQSHSVKGQVINHPTNISGISSLQEHILIRGDTHFGLWLSGGIAFIPGKVPKDFHFFFVETDRKGGDSMQKHHHFAAKDFPKGDKVLSDWRDSWKEVAYPDALQERKDKEGYRFVPSFNWKYHKQSGKVIGFGHLLRHKGQALSNHLEHLAITYSVYDPNTQVFSQWNSFNIEIDGKEVPCVAYGQRVDLPNGDILIPFSTIKKLEGWNSIRWCGSARCRFDGEKITVVETGNLVTHPVPRGFVEPSMAEYNGTFYMTLRAQDGHSHVTTSRDGLTWEKPVPWKWDNGEAIAMEQTMTKFISRDDGLYLVYTRITTNNNNVFRNRAPLFVARIDSENRCLVRKTESVVLGNKGFPLGNFWVYPVKPNETWIISQEWDRNGRDIDCNNLLGRIIWKTN